MKLALWVVPVVAAAGLAVVGLAYVPFERIGWQPPEALPPPTAVRSAPPDGPPAAPTQATSPRTVRPKQDLAVKCKALISGLMGRPVEIMTALHPFDGDEAIAFVSYERDDASVWKYQCKTDGRTIVWRGVDIDGPGSGPGRWREEDRVPLSSL